MTSPDRMQHKTQLRKNFDTGNYSTGASSLKRALWYLTSVIFFESKLMPSSGVLVGLLRLYGASIGKDVRIKPGLYVKFPWKLKIGDHSWLADCYIENLAEVSIGGNCCVSQRAILMTGNHDYKKLSFDLITKRVILEDGAWIGAAAMVSPGVTVGSHAVLAMGSVATGNLEAYKIYQGNPAVAVRERFISG